MALHDHFEVAVWQSGKCNACIFERLIDPDLRQMPRSNGRLFKAINCALSHARFFSKFCLTPAKHGPRSSHLCGKKQGVRFDAEHDRC